MLAFLIGAGAMALGGIAELFLGVKAEQMPLEDIAKPLTAEEAETGELGGRRAADEPISRGRESEPESDAQRRWRERDERRSARERERRYRPGPGPGEMFYSPGMLGTAVRTRTPSPSLLDREIDAIAAAVGEAGGALSRNEVYRRVGARRWGPGRFQNALQSALDEGRIVRAGRASYGPGGREN